MRVLAAANHANLHGRTRQSHGFHPAVPAKQTIERQRYCDTRLLQPMQLRGTPGWEACISQVTPGASLLML